MPVLATTAIFIDKYHPKQDGTCSISIRVTHDRKKRYYPTPISLTETDFQKTQGRKPRDPFKQIALSLQAYENRAAEIIGNLPIFTWEGFERQYLRNKGAKDSIHFAFAEYITVLRESDRIGTAVSYECAQSSIGKFKPDLRFAEVTPDLLKRYEKWMLANEKSITTVGIYLRSLRTLFNNAIADGLISMDLYPFGKKKYEIPTGKNIKKALTLSDIEMIYNYEAMPGSSEEMARDYWLFMYLCNGINVKDLCLLTFDNIKGDFIEFERAKTVRTKRIVEPIRIVITEDAKRIISKWGTKNAIGKNYIFPVLKMGLAAERERQLIQQLTKLINKYMKKIASEIGVLNDVTTYAARHSFATILQRSGASTEFISEALGHGNIKTTQSYLAGFEDSSKKDAIKALTAFKKTA